MVSFSPAAPNIEVLYDSALAAYMGGISLIFRPSLHVVLENHPWIKMVRRVCRKDALMLYRHRREGTWVLGEWIHRPGEGKGPGLIHEIEVFERSPNWTVRDVRDRLDSCHRVQHRIRDSLRAVKDRLLTQAAIRSENHHKAVMEDYKRYGPTAANITRRLTPAAFDPVTDAERDRAAAAMRNFRLRGSGNHRNNGKRR